MSQRVDAISADVVRHRNDVVVVDGKRGNIIGDHDAIDGDRVVGPIAREARGVEINTVVIVDNLTRDNELSGFDRAIKHERNELRQVICSLYLGARPVCIGAHADVRVEPQVAIDQVVAATADDDIAAIAAENDIAGGERGHRADQCVDKALQAGNALHARLRECAAQSAAVAEHTRRSQGIGSQVITLQEVAELRAR